MKRIKRLKYRTGGERVRLPAGGLGRRMAEAARDEHLTGQVQGLPASEGEERSVRAAEKNSNVRQVHFRVPVGAARNMPGWKELDLLIEARSGLYYAIEVDSEFTHRNKSNADILHDAIILHELSYLNIYPKVFHVDNERDLASQQMADETFRRIIV